MPTQKLDKSMRKSIMEARAMMEAVAKDDANEAETRRRIERFFESLMGYDVFKHVTREHAIHGIGDAEHCDFAIQVDEETKKPVILVEIKRVSVDIAQKHLKQAASYAINIGCEWVILTNGKTWQLYHISYGQPPQTKLIEAWDLMTDEPEQIAQKFEVVSYKHVKKDGLKHLWEKRNVLTPANILKIVLSESSLTNIRRSLKKSTGVLVTPEEVVGAIRSLLNEAGLVDMDGIKICLPRTAPVKRVIKPAPPTTKPDETQPVQPTITL